MGASSLPIGLTGNLFNLWGLTRNAQADEPLDPRAEPVTPPVTPPITGASNGTDEDAAERPIRTRGPAQ